MIDLEVGNGSHQVNFHVPERSLSSISSAFASMLQTQVEADDQGRLVLHLPDDDPEAWKVLFYAQFSRSLPHMYTGATFFDIERAKFLALLVKCWLLGDKYSALQFQDRIMAELVQAMARTVAHPVPISLAALHATPGSPLFQFMVEEEAGRLNEEMRMREEMWLNEEFKQLNEELKWSPKRPTVAEDLGRDDIPRAFLDAVAAVDLSVVFLGYDRLSSRKQCLRLMVDGGPDKSWLHVPIPFCDSHDPPQIRGKNVYEEQDEDEDEEEQGKPSLSRLPTLLRKFCNLLSIRSK